MANPIPGQNYVVVIGDTMSGISAKAYGDPSKWESIWNANLLRVKSTNPEIIFPGEVLFIPLDPFKESLSERQITDKDKYSLTLLIENIEVPVESAKIIRTMDTLADMFTAVISWVPGLDTTLDNYLKPFKYPKTKIYLGNVLMLTGTIYGIGASFSNGKRTKTLTAFSKIIDAVDSTMRPPYEESNVTLKQRVEKVLKNYGVNVEYELVNDGQFDRVTAEPSESIAAHVLKLVAQRAALITSTPEGNVKIYKPNTTGPTVGTLEEGQTLVTAWNGNWDGRQLFNSYRVTLDSPLGSETAISKDKNVPKSRFLTSQAPDMITGSLQDTADWKRSKKYGDALTQQIPVSGWYNPEDELWTENTLVSIKSETLHIPDGYTYLIKSVEYNFGTSNEALLNIVPPQIFTGEEIVFPW